ncbi:MAG: sugar ABC transporter permease [Spirochaetia bacterium]|jgi:multiple sugar transport system permease protein
MKEKQLKWVLVAPALTMIVALIIFPLIYALRAALYLYRYGKPFQFVGLRNFVELFQNPLVLNAVINTVIYVAIAVTAELALGLLLALIMNREIRGFSRPVRAALTIPMFIAPVVVGIIWRMMYNPQYGLFDWLLGIRNFAATGGNHALYFVALADIWQWTPFMYIIILAALQSVSPELIEASIIDGASQWQRTTRIILPSISAALVIAFTLRFMEATKALDIIYTLTFGGPGTDTETVGFMIFRLAFNDIRVGTSTAFALLYTIIISVVLGFFMNWLNRRYEIV